MNAQKLTLSGLNLKNNKPFQMVLKASNPFMLGIKYQQLDRDFYIEDWLLINSEWEAGNNGINAGAYLCETLEELTGLNLA
jgi:hypothetical protein